MAGAVDGPDGRAPGGLRAGQVTQAVLDLRAGAHEAQSPPVRPDGPQLERRQVRELPVARVAHEADAVTLSGDVLEDERGARVEHAAPAAAVIDRLVGPPAVAADAMGADLERAEPAVVDRARGAQQHTPRDRGAVELQLTGGGHDHVRAAQSPPPPAGVPR